MKTISKDNSVRWLTLVLAMAGLLLILISFLLPPEWMFRREFTKELGIVIFAVFTVSLVYEAMLAQRHRDKFLALLQQQIEQLENNAAVCEHFGIIQIFPRRDIFETKHPFSEAVSSLGPKDEIRIIARTLFHIMTHPEALKDAIRNGAHVQLCALKPEVLEHQAAKISVMSAKEIETAIGIFKDEIATWIKETNPPGAVVLRFHKFPLLDSCLIDNSRVVWDLSFGRDLVSKRIFLVNKERPFGQDLINRYDKVWESAEGSTVFEYDNGKLTVDDL